ncbi:MAG: hypothetical protein ACT4PY_04070 [Armatimonadota bacterium]
MHQPERIAHIEQALERYKRDLGLMTGRLTPSLTDIDDGAIMDRLAWSEDQHGLISDRRLRIKTLEAMLELLRERNGG